MRSGRKEHHKPEESNSQVDISLHSKIFNDRSNTNSKMDGAQYRERPFPYDLSLLTLLSEKGLPYPLGSHKSHK